MARKPTSDRRNTNKPRTSRSVIEWIGGIVSLDSWITGEGEPFRPECLFWMNAEGQHIGVFVGRPGDAIAGAGKSLRDTIEDPEFGIPHRPTRVRVASPELADALRSAQRDIEIVCAPTPEVDASMDALQEYLNSADAPPETYLSDDIGPREMASFFDAAAALFRAKPWDRLPVDMLVSLVTIEELELRDAVVVVHGHAGLGFGLSLFESLENNDAWLDALERAEEAGIDLEALSNVPPRLALYFEKGADLSPELRKEIAVHHWSVASSHAYPWVDVVEADQRARPPTAAELTRAEAVCRALARFAGERTLLSSWNGEEILSRRYALTTAAGELDVSLTTPVPEDEPGFDATTDVLAELTALDRRGNVYEAPEREALEDELLRRFYEAPESKGLHNALGPALVMLLAPKYLGRTIATVAGPGLEKVLLRHLPQESSFANGVGRHLIEETRAFYSFLKREYDFAFADDCLRTLSDDLVQRLDEAIAARNETSPLQQFLAQGRAAGFDMNSRDGIETWFQKSEEGAPSSPPPAAEKKRKGTPKRKK